jgi:hypothetical protein
MKRQRTRAIRIQVCDLDGKNVRNYHSIHYFLKLIAFGRKLSVMELNKIRGNEAVVINNSLLFRFGNKRKVMAMEKQREREIILRANRELVLEARRQLKNSAQSIILILDNDFQVKEMYMGSTIEFAKRERLTYTDVKSKLSRFKRFVTNHYNIRRIGKIGFNNSLLNSNRRNEKQYAYATDYFTFINTLA